MTALHQALIKAFAQQDKGVALPRKPAAPKIDSPLADNPRQPAAAGSREGPGSHPEDSHSRPDSGLEDRHSGLEDRHSGLEDRHSGLPEARTIRVPLKDAFGAELAAFDKLPPRAPSEPAFPVVPECLRTLSALHPADAAPETTARTVAASPPDWPRAKPLAETEAAVARHFEPPLAAAAQAFSEGPRTLSALHPADAAAEKTARTVAASPPDWPRAKPLAETEAAVARHFEPPLAAAQAFSEGPRTLSTLHPADAARTRRMRRRRQRQERLPPARPIGPRPSSSRRP